MDRFRIGVIVGSLRQGSFNRRLSQALLRLAPPEFECREIAIRDLPLYDQDEDAHPAQAVQRLKSAIEDVDALLFVTPEYNRSIPGVLKNALDHASRPYGRNSWAGKPAGIVGASIGAIGTAAAQQHLRTILAYLDVPTLGQPEVFLQLKDESFDKSGILNGASMQFLQGWMARYVKWVKQHASAQPRAQRAAGSGGSEEGPAAREQVPEESMMENLSAPTRRVI